jgi:hypothetical protein
LTLACLGRVHLPERSEPCESLPLLTGAMHLSSCSSSHDAQDAQKVLRSLCKIKTALRLAFAAMLSVSEEISPQNNLQLCECAALISTYGQCRHILNKLITRNRDYSFAIQVFSQGTLERSRSRIVRSIRFVSTDPASTCTRSASYSALYVFLLRQNVT